MNIHVIFTGGTIGSEENAQYIDIAGNTASVLLNSVNTYNKDITFTCENPFSELSENLTYKHWNILVECLFNLPQECDGVIITHGSDSLVYTAAAMAMLFSHLNIPVVFTAANYPLGDTNSNGQQNFKNAVDFIVNAKLKGCFVSYSNTKQENTIYLATRMLESDSYNDFYLPFGTAPIGNLENGVFMINKAPDLPSALELCAHTSEITDNFRFEKDVLFIKAMPNQNYSYYNLRKKPSAVVLYLYHSGTGCTTNGKNSLLDFIKECKLLDIPVFIASLKNNSKPYATTKTLLGTHTIPLYNISPASAYAKACIAVNQDGLKLSDYMQKTIFFETLP